MLVSSIDEEEGSSQKIVLSTIKDCALILKCLLQSKRDGGSNFRKCKIYGNGATSGNYLHIINILFKLIQASYNNSTDVPPLAGDNTQVSKLFNKLTDSLRANKYSQLSSNIQWDYERLRIALLNYWEGDVYAQNFFNEIIDSLEDFQNILQVNRPV